jgi:Domain of unknown function (DUF4288)
MSKKPRVHGLDDFRLTLADLTRLGDRPVRLSVQLVGQSVSALRHLRPTQRDARLRKALANQLERLKRRFQTISFVSRGKRKASWTIDAIVPARRVLELASKPEVKHVQLDTIEGRRKKPSRRGPSWFCVWGVVAVQIEEQSKGLITLEDRLVLVRANDPDEAQRKLQREWSNYARPYLNPYGYLVRWQLINVRDVYELYEDQLDPRGTEVFSRLRKVRLRPEYRWRPHENRKRTRST